MTTFQRWYVSNYNNEEKKRLAAVGSNPQRRDWCLRPAPCRPLGHATTRNDHFFWLVSDRPNSAATSEQLYQLVVVIITNGQKDGTVGFRPPETGALSRSNTSYATTRNDHFTGMLYITMAKEKIRQGWFETHASEETGALSALDRSARTTRNDHFSAGYVSNYNDGAKEEIGGGFEPHTAKRLVPKPARTARPFPHTKTTFTLGML
ncbi:hypothetical protein AVEN_99093-1 [Araneus ventricosus]|uniref:Uncharacterized protein n=1 Tax=Araneus ventricosus TaxID=182803 RepID=A0A4Y2K3D8_ARAVE|nr:hypothetical protein AVEN_99093-1 [Araneus ventricosus]